MTFGERIVFYRKKAGLSQKALAELIDVTPTRLNYWEKDKREPDIKMINALCVALNVEGDVLLGRSAESKKSPSADDVAPGDQVTLEESNRLLVTLGYIREGEELSDDDLAFLTHIIGLLDAWFSGKRE